MPAILWLISRIVPVDVRHRWREEFRSRLHGVSPVDPLAFGGGALLLPATMIVASLAPAHRALDVDPIQVLRTE